MLVENYKELSSLVITIKPPRKSLDCSLRRSLDVIYGIRYFVMVGKIQIRL